MQAADFEGLLRGFSSKGIRFIIIGGVSAALQGVPTVTFDLDLVLEQKKENLDLAFEEQRQLEAVFREHLPKRTLPERKELELAGAMLLMTRLGPLDLLGEVATGWRYPELLSRSHVKNLGDELEVQVLDLEALIQIKELVGREKDLAALPEYRRSLLERDAKKQRPS